jgi:hypothetical protein
MKQNAGIHENKYKIKQEHCMKGDDSLKNLLGFLILVLFNAISAHVIIHYRLTNLTVIIAILAASCGGMLYQKIISYE